MDASTAVCDIQKKIKTKKNGWTGESAAIARKETAW